VVRVIVSSVPSCDVANVRSRLGASPETKGSVPTDRLPSGLVSASGTCLGAKPAESTQAVRADRHRPTVFHDADGPAIRHNDLNERTSSSPHASRVAVLHACPALAIEASVTPQGAPKRQ